MAWVNGVGLHKIKSLDEIFWRYRTTETGYYCQGAGAPVTSEHSK
jgi:CRISPR-associated protein Csy2